MVVLPSSLLLVSAEPNDGSVVAQAPRRLQVARTVLAQARPLVAPGG